MNMKIGAVAILAALGAVSTGRAADLTAAGPEPTMPAEVTSWTGFYAGLHAGYGFGQKQDVDIKRVGYGQFEWLSKAGDVSPSGVFGGAQIGYNLQYGNFVIGIETDIDASGLRDNSRGRFNPWKYPDPTFYYYDYHHRTKIDWFGTLRPRIGYAAGDFLFYLTGGLAYGGIKTQSDFHSAGPGNGFTYAGHFSESGSKAGYALGGGVEYAIARNWSVKLEYQYLDFGKQKLHSFEHYPDDTPPSYATGQNYSSKVRTSFHTVRLGVNYRF